MMRDDLTACRRLVDEATGGDDMSEDSGTEAVADSDSRSDSTTRSDSDSRSDATTPSDSTPRSDSMTRLVRVPTLGSKLSVLAALLILVLAVYFLLSPAQVHAKGGRAFDCGTAVSGPDTSFAEGICGSANEARRAMAYASGAAALLVGVGGVVCFGFQSRRETARWTRSPDDED
jgi:hypothetical protein